MRPIQMVDLKSQYLKIKSEVDSAILNVIDETSFIKGSDVKSFEQELALYTQSSKCISCANGTDALQIAMMALNINPGDEIIMPAFTYIATVETAALLGIKVKLVDVSKNSFNIDADQIEKAITKRTKAIVPVHLYGQCADMETILNIANKYKISVIEDAAQAIGSEYTFSTKDTLQAGTMGNIGCTSFFPSKNLGCFGDGGALFTNDLDLAKKITMIANHGQDKKYIHEIIGVNSRLDTIQAAILRIKLKHLDEYIKERQKVAAYYDKFIDKEKYIIPFRQSNSTHVFHQYTIKLKAGERDKLKAFLESHKIPSMVYYPLPIHYQIAFKNLGYKQGDFPVAEDLCKEVISLPIHTEMDHQQLEHIVEILNNFI